MLEDGAIPLHVLYSKFGSLRALNWQSSIIFELAYAFAFCPEFAAQSTLSALPEDSPAPQCQEPHLRGLQCALAPNPHHQS